MTATQIMREIDLLPPREQAKVVDYTKQLVIKQPLSGYELTALAKRMVEATDPAEGDRLQEKLVNGFFGG